MAKTVLSELPPADVVSRQDNPTEGKYLVPKLAGGDDMGKLAGCQMPNEIALSWRGGAVVSQDITTTLFLPQDLTTQRAALKAAGCSVVRAEKANGSQSHAPGD